jgi:hypothetical protein
MELIKQLGWHFDRDVYGIALPRWIGIADTDIASRRVLLLPIPVNVIYAFSIKVFLWMRTFGAYKDKIYQNGSSKGFSEGYKSGFEDGTKEGGRKAREDMLEVLRLIKDPQRPQQVHKEDHSQ